MCDRIQFPITTFAWIGWFRFSRGVSYFMPKANQIIQTGFWFCIRSRFDLTLLRLATFHFYVHAGHFWFFFIEDIFKFFPFFLHLVCFWSGRGQLELSKRSGWSSKRWGWSLREFLYTTRQRLKDFDRFLVRWFTVMFVDGGRLRGHIMVAFKEPQNFGHYINTFSEYFDHYFIPV